MILVLVALGVATCWYTGAGREAVTARGSEPSDDDGKGPAPAVAARRRGAAPRSTALDSSLAVRDDGATAERPTRGRAARARDPIAIEPATRDYAASASTSGTGGAVGCSGYDCSIHRCPDGASTTISGNRLRPSGKEPGLQRRRVRAEHSPYRSDKVKPQGCANGERSPQKKAIEFALFDLSSRVTPGDTPKEPPTNGKSEPRSLGSARCRARFFGDGSVAHEAGLAAALRTTAGSAAGARVASGPSCPARAIPAASMNTSPSDPASLPSAGPRAKVCA